MFSSYPNPNNNSLSIIISFITRHSVWKLPKMSHFWHKKRAKRACAAGLVRKEKTLLAPLAMFLDETFLWFSNTVDKVFFPIKGWACTGCVSGKRHEWWMFCSLPWRSNLSNALRKCPYFLQSYGIWTAFGSSFRHRRLHFKACRNCLLHPFIHFLRFAQNDNFVKIYLKLAWQQFCLIK